MKKILFVCMITACVQLSFGQKYAYIDSDYILNNMPSYVEAQAELNRLSLNWQKEIEGKFAEIDAMYRKYQQDA
ncbi:MAG: OmpH family outer membrane protein, partial [Bacteroidales bacterium]|nr:OmpH family outer membrane protein [Bacteroidales bacterium]